MKYFVLDRGDSLSRSLTGQFHALAASRGMQLSEDEPDVVLSIGGDGTMLHAFHVFKERLDSIAFVGIHTGHLGFFADWKADEIERLANLMAESGSRLQDKIVKYPLVKIELTTSFGVETFLALNEFTLKGADATLVAQLNINDSPFEMFRGDGICISTPSGSTAYNKSLGGALIHPSLEAIQIAEIASINNRVYRTIGSSLILPKHHHCDIVPKKEQKVVLTVDHLAVPHTSVLNVRSMVAERKVSFARYRPFPFWNRVREAFVGDDVK
ncbi:NAD kinase [Paenibacillus alkalitolerans]|uniref:NAD kinase n=1 Tax=Paenibacillus alkalitolerans TaxID=2799335 RepID=UPI0018F72C05|nr:NAD kinase [Paenibacillus alkalitolerans]